MAKLFSLSLVMLSVLFYRAYDACAQVIVVAPKAGLKAAEQATQIVSIARLNDMAHAAITEQLPPRMRLVAIEANSAVRLPKGPVSLSISSAAPLDVGRHEIRLHLRVGTSDVKDVSAHVIVATHGKGRPVPIVQRGHSVRVIVRTANIMLEAGGVTQDAGAVGEQINVLPSVGTRVVKARVINAHTVEVAL